MTKTLVACPEEPEEPDGTSIAFAFQAGPFESIVYDCERSGHLLTEHTIETVEGDLRGYCEHCSQVFRMKRMPGGITAVRVRALISALAEEDWKDGVGLLLEYSYLERALRQDLRALKECGGLMDIASELVDQHLTLGEP